MLSSIFLTFQDRDMKMAYQNEKRSFYSKTLFTLFIVMLLLTVAVFALEATDKQYEQDMITHVINIACTVLYLVLWLLIKRTHAAAYFICPILTAYAFYYFAFVDYDGSSLSIYYTMIVGITSSFFILIIFNESWVISSMVYSPLVCFYMFKTGKDMVGYELNELIIRCIYCVFLYIICAYKIEALNKQSFLGSQSQENAFYRWLKIFETFPEGLALVRKGQIMYANKSLPEMFEYNEYTSNEDPYNESLKKLLNHTDVTRLGNEQDSYNTTAWEFLELGEKGAPFSFNIQSNMLEEDNPEMQRNADGSYTKYISMNKINVNVAGSQDKLFVVRDLNSMVNLQKLMYMKKHLQNFTEKVVRQIQESSEVSLINLQKLDSYLTEGGHSVAEETLNESKRILHRIIDFEQVYNISEGNFIQASTNFRVSDILSQIKAVSESEFEKRNIKGNFVTDTTVPDLIRSSHTMFRQVVLNLLGTIMAGSIRCEVTVKAASESIEGGHLITVEIINNKNIFSKEQHEQIDELCLEEDLVRILEAGQTVDVNFIIALILARQSGWPISFQVEGNTCKFIVEVSAQSSGAAAKADPATVAVKPFKRAPALVTPQPVPNIVKMTKDISEVKAPAKVEETEVDGPVTLGEYPECLLVSCSDLVPLFEKGLGFKCDESFLEESAINSVTRSIKKNRPYKFIFVDLDDPTLLLGRFMVAINKLLDANPRIKIGVYACSSSSSERMLKKCREVKVTFIPKPMTKDKVKHLQKLYK